MILTEKIKRDIKNRNCKCETKCNCKKKKRGILGAIEETPKRNISLGYDDENFDDENNTFENASTLEEHFENFGEAFHDATENFLPLIPLAVLKATQTKAGKARRKARQEARQEKRLSRIRGSQKVREAKQAQQIKALESAPETKEQAETQALQVNTLQKAVQPNSAPISAVETPTGSGSGSEQLYKTLPMGNEGTQQSGLTGMSAGSTGTEEGAEQGAPETATSEKLTPAESPKKKSSKTLYLIIGAVAVVGIYFFMKKKK